MPSHFGLICHLQLVSETMGVFVSFLFVRFICSYHKRQNPFWASIATLRRSWWRATFVTSVEVPLTNIARPPMRRRVIDWLVQSPYFFVIEIMHCSHAQDKLLGWQRDMPPDIHHAGNSKHLSLTFCRSYTSWKFGSLTANALQPHQFLEVGSAVFRSSGSNLDTNKQRIQTRKIPKRPSFWNQL